LKRYTTNWALALYGVKARGPAFTVKIAAGIRLSTLIGSTPDGRRRALPHFVVVLCQSSTCAIAAEPQTLLDTAYTVRWPAIRNGRAAFTQANIQAHAVGLLTRVRGVYALLSFRAFAAGPRRSSTRRTRPGSNDRTDSRVNPPVVLCRSRMPGPLGPVVWSTQLHKMRRQRCCYRGRKHATT